MITELIVVAVVAIIVVSAAFLLRSTGVPIALGHALVHVPILRGLVRRRADQETEDQLLDELQRIPTALSTSRAVLELRVHGDDSDTGRYDPYRAELEDGVGRPGLQTALAVAVAASEETMGYPREEGAPRNSGSPNGRRAEQRALPSVHDASPGWVVRGHTNQGLQRERNEDEHLATAELVIVADGIGGGPAGDLAARIVVETVHHVLSRAEDPSRDLATAVDRAASALFGAAVVNAELRGMGSTVDVVVLAAGRSPVAHGAHVGDGAVWLIPAPGRPVALTEPHRDESGKLTGAVSSITDPRPDTWRRNIREGDRLVLTSDGFHAHLQDDEHATQLLEEFRSDPPHDAARSLVSAALGAGGRDNVTVVVADYWSPDRW